ncbi:MAG: hypothetical protein IPK80_04370 [Nannocystis sp.]|nr:hypothetical protein [Nannocystis sp.]
MPSSDSSYPSNAALLFWGYDISLAGVSVTIDGEAAALAPAPFADSWATLAAVVEPAPAPGQVVVLSGDFCLGGGCEHTLSYTASAADLVAPIPDPAGSFFAVFDHGDVQSSGGDCLVDHDLTIYVHVALDEAAPGSAPGLTRASAGSVSGGSFGGRVPIPLVVSQLGGKDPTSLCFTVEALDLAGNAAPAFELCNACYYRADDAPNDGYTIIPEPEWGAMDLAPGGACAAAGETTGDTGDTGDTGSTGDSSASSVDSATDGGQDDDKGCACAVTGGEGPSSALWLLGVMLLLRRRRAALRA